MFQVFQARWGEYLDARWTKYETRCNGFEVKYRLICGSSTHFRFQASSFEIRPLTRYRAVTSAPLQFPMIISESETEAYCSHVTDIKLILSLQVTWNVIRSATQRWQSWSLIKNAYWMYLNQTCFIALGDQVLFFKDLCYNFIMMEVSIRILHSTSRSCVRFAKHSDTRCYLIEFMRKINLLLWT